jgi:peptidylprolyl isomerase
MTSSTYRRAALVVTLFALIAAACGDGAADSTTTTTIRTADTSATTAAPAAGGGAAAGDTVSVHYIGTLPDGTEFDASRPRGSTLDFTIGGGRMISGFDAAVVGMKVGDVKTVTLEPADAYGPVDPEAIQEVPLEDLPEGIEVGTQLQTGDGRVVEVVEVRETTALVDFNHPLAGETLTFEIEMVSIQPAG